MPAERTADDDPAIPIEERIRARLRAVRERDRLTFRAMDQRYETGGWWFVDFLRRKRPLHHRLTDSQKRRLFLALPELRDDLIALSLSWVPNREEPPRA